jgi:hypothetical protein
VTISAFACRCALLTPLAAALDANCTTAHC